MCVCRQIFDVMRSQVASTSLPPTRYQVLLLILLLTGSLVDARYHVIRAESYPLRVRRVVEEKLPDTNGMFFGKRSTSAAAAIGTFRSPKPQDSPFLPSSEKSPFLSSLQRSQKVPSFCRRQGGLRRGRLVKCSITPKD